MIAPNGPIQDGDGEIEQTMEIPSIYSVETKEQGHDLAVQWQHWQSEQSLSYGELHEWQVFFEQVAEKFPDLRDEFKENAII